MSDTSDPGSSSANDPTLIGNEHRRPPLARSLVQGKGAFIAVMVGVVAAVIGHRLLIAGRLEHTSLVFVGLPALIAIAIALLPRPATITGVILKAIAIALALSGVLFGEGFVCILMASPIFFLVGIVIGLILDYFRTRPTRLDLRVTVLVLALVGPSLEGVIPGFEFDRIETVTRTRFVPASASEVEAALAHTSRFERELPAFFKLGFPIPGETSGEGLTIGAERSVEFLHGSHHPGRLVLRVSTRDSFGGVQRVTFRPVVDDSYITHWLSWRDIDVAWHEVAPGRTEVSWTLRYRRRLDPAWYFAPLERYGVGLAAGYLIDTLATPTPLGTHAKPAVPSTSHAHDREAMR